jgi:multiple sugar transport system ATP-binding protein
VLYERPANTFVAGFIGSPAMNLIELPVGNNGSLALGGVRVPLPANLAADGREAVVLGLRPESLELAADGIAAQVEVVEELGADAYVFCAAEVGRGSTRLVARTETRRVPARGERVTLRPLADEAHLFDPSTGDRLDG